MSMTSKILSRTVLPFALAAMATVSAATLASAQEKVLRIGMTAADVPKTNGQPDQGFEGNRFTGIPMFDALTHWDLSSADKASVLIPGLATEWKVSDSDKTKWTFKLRPGIKFHDGSAFNADAVVWNVQKVLDKAAAAFCRRSGWRYRFAHADIAQRQENRRSDGGTDDQRAGFVPAYQSHQFVYGVSGPLGGQTGCCASLCG